MKKKEKVIIESYTTGLEFKYKGRLIGLLTDEEFRDLIRNKEIQSSLITTETLPFSVLRNIDKGDVKNKRLVISVSEINDKHTSGVLFISQALDLICYADPKIEQIGITTKDDEYLSLSEVGEND